MTDSARPKILILEADDTTRLKTGKILEDRGWEVVCESKSKEALARLKQTASHPFHLFISNFDLQTLQGSAILQQSKAISPMTRRMLTVSAQRPDMVIRAVNKAEIHACIVTPATNRELVDKVRSCIEDFNRDMKREQMRRVVTHQNKQLFIIAQRLKKRDRLRKDRISARKKEELRLATLLARVNSQKKDPVTLGGRIKAHGIEVTPASLALEFNKLAGFTRTLLDHIAVKAGISPSFEEIHDIITAHPAPGEDAREEDPTQREFVRQILRTAFSSPPSPPAGVLEEEETPPLPQTIENLIGIRVSRDEVRAFIRLETQPADPGLLNLSDLLDLLRRRSINFGIVEDEAIESWLADARPGGEEFMVAEAQAPVPPVHGAVAYEFETDFTNPGKIMEDGRMDFRDRGEIPFVSKGDLLAVKTPSREGQDGMSVSGEEITVDEARDPVMIAGSGTTLSKDGLSIHAGLDGQPHLDPMGEISVNPELPIRGDVNYETGNIEFNGNIIVQGTVKDGFRVKGVSLTAKEVEGGIIDLTGDLCVTDGITDAQIVSVGNVYARFINNSTVNAFGNVVVQKEIIDSGIRLSGGLENPSGVIMSSKIAAKAGVEAGRIGTDTSKPSHLRVGVDDHIESRTQEIDTRLDASRQRLQEIGDKIERVEAEDRDLYSCITEKAQEQEHLQKRIDTLQAALGDLKQRGDQAGEDQAARDILKLRSALERTEEELNAIFATQDTHARKIEAFKGALEQIETGNKTLVMKKKGLREFSQKNAPRPVVIVNKSITQETVVMGPNTSVTLQLDLKRCLIQEKQLSEDGFYHYKMDISDL